MSNDEVNFSSEVDLDSKGNPVDKGEENFTATTPESVKDDTTKESTAVKEAEKPENTAQDLADNIAKENRKLQDQAHLSALETIGVVFNKYNADEQKEFFMQRPELAKVADKSKKYKQQYRNLSKVEEVVEKSTESKVEEVSEVDADKFKSELLLDVQEQNLKDSRRKMANDIAVKEGLDEDGFNKLHELAEALYDKDVDYDVALEAAKVSLGVKNSGANNLPSGDNLGGEEVKDAKAEINRIMKESVVSEETATKIYNHIQLKESRGESLDLSKGFIEAPMD